MKRFLFRFGALAAVIAVGCSQGGSGSFDFAPGAGGAGTAGSDIGGGTPSELPEAGRADGGAAGELNVAGSGGQAGNALGAAGAAADAGAGNADMTTLIGPAGGEVVSPDGAAHLSIPAGALKAPIAFSIAPIPSPLSGAIGTVYEVQPTGTVFDVPAFLTLKYDVAAVSEAQKASLSVATLESGAWKPVLSAGLPATHEVAGLLNHLSLYCVVSGPVTPPPCDCNTTCFKQACQFQYGSVISADRGLCTCAINPGQDLFNFYWGIDDYYSSCAKIPYTSGQCTPCIKKCVRDTHGVITYADPTICNAEWLGGDFQAGLSCEAACHDPIHWCGDGSGGGGGTGGASSGGASSGGASSGGASSGGRASTGGGSSVGGHPGTGGVTGIGGGLSLGGNPGSGGSTGTGGMANGGAAGAASGGGGGAKSAGGTGGTGGGTGGTGGTSGTAGAGGTNSTIWPSHFHVAIGPVDQTIDCTELDLDATDPASGDVGYGYQELGGESQSTGQTFKVKAPLSAVRLRDASLVTDYPIATFTSTRWLASNTPDALFALSLRLVDDQGKLWTSCGPGDCGLATDDTTFRHQIVSIVEESKASGKATFRISGTYYALVTNAGAYTTASGDWSILVTVPDPGPTDCLQGCASSDGKTCLAGNTAAACGTVGQTCQICSGATPLCVQQKCMQCVPGKQQTTSCNNGCGTTTQTCSAQGVWGLPTSCSGGPSCGNSCCSGTQLCTSCPSGPQCLDKGARCQ